MAPLLAGRLSVCEMEEPGRGHQEQDQWPPSDLARKLTDGLTSWCVPGVKMSPCGSAGLKFMS